MSPADRSAESILRVLDADAAAALVSPAEAMSLYAYSENGSAALSAFLLGGEPMLSASTLLTASRTIMPEREARAVMADMDSVLSRVHSSVPVILHHAGTADGPDIERAAVSAAMAFNHRIYVRPTYLSGSAEPVPGETMRVTVPAGSPALSMRGFSGHPEEAEVLLPRGSRFHVDGVDPDDGTVLMTWIGIDAAASTSLDA